jgi:hypothetical protein
MVDDNSKMLEKFQQILKELTIHAKEERCTHSLQELLDTLEFEPE